MYGLSRPVVDQQGDPGDDCSWLQGKLKHRDRADGHELLGLIRRAVILAALYPREISITGLPHPTPAPAISNPVNHFSQE